ncbi:hypothetical protein AQUCO_00400661v1 [Aquilegia coerulea]|uniref:F-box domain-containing protein n=1 Tax=Aquilegia coerulea TaxID=218851 RepID=A0A2G5EW35_AQUCA|nr:hypothetical protein AQUCO_00400661v1 [Aquilegia coerulea]
MISTKKMIMFSSFPEDMIICILCRIPLKDLMRFKTVCKLWYSIISDSNFHKFHLAPSQQEIILRLTTLSQPEKYWVDVDLQENIRYMSIHIQDRNNIRAENFCMKFPPADNLRIRASCNGLLLLLEPYRRVLYICNPVTAHYSKLPTKIRPRYLERYYWTLFYDETVGKYKTFGIIDKKCVMHTVGEKAWSTLDSPYFCKLNTSMVSAEKELHWLGYGHRTKHWIFSVKLSTLEFSITKAPAHIFKRHHLLSVVKGSLCLTSISGNELEIFVLEDRANCIWTKYYSTDLQSLPNRPTSFTSFLYSPKRNIHHINMRDINCYDFSELLKIFVHHEDKLFLYDLKSKECMEIAPLSQQEVLAGYHFNYFYSRS